jgi:hypothetical protein
MSTPRAAFVFVVVVEWFAAAPRVVREPDRPLRRTNR